MFNKPSFFQTLSSDLTMNSTSFSGRAWLKLFLIGFFLISFTPAASAQRLVMDEAKTSVKAFDFNAKYFSGESVKLSKFHGQVIFLNFWATWCIPCRLEMPSMEILKGKLEGEKFVMLAVNIMEESEKVEKFLAEFDAPLTFGIVMDKDGKISSTYSASNLPITYIIDKKGFVRWRAVGGRPWDSPEAVKLLRAMAKE